MTRKRAPARCFPRPNSSSTSKGSWDLTSIRTLGNSSASSTGVRNEVPHEDPEQPCHVSSFVPVARPAAAFQFRSGTEWQEVFLRRSTAGANVHRRQYLWIEF